MSIRASVIIITKNQIEFLKKSLPILIKQKLLGSHEIIVVDSGSSDGAIEYCRTLPIKLVQISPDQFNYANAFNLGAKIAKGDFLIRLSGDAIPTNRHFISEMIKPFGYEGSVGGTYGKYVITGKKGWGYPEWWPESRFPDHETRHHLVPNPFRDFLGFTPLESYALAGGCCAIRRNTWQERPFNEQMSAGEDGEYAWYLHATGYDIVYNPKASVIHEHQTSRTHTDFLLSLPFSKFVWQGYFSKISYWAAQLNKKLFSK